MSYSPPAGSQLILRFKKQSYLICKPPGQPERAGAIKVRPSLILRVLSGEGASIEHGTPRRVEVVIYDSCRA